MNSMGAQAWFGQKNQHSMFFVICYHLMKFEIIFSWLVVSKWPSSCSVSYYYCQLSEIFPHSKLFYGWGKKNPENTLDKEKKGI